MRLRKWLAVAVALALPAGALAAELTGSHAVEGYAALHVPTGTYTLRLTGAEANKSAVFSGSGERLSAAYDQIDVRQDWPYYYVTSGDQNNINVHGLVDGSGQEVLPPVYGRIDVINDRWVVGCVLEDWSTIASADVFFDGRMIGTLGAEDYTMSTYTAAHGAYLGVSGGQAGFYLNSRFERVEGTAEYFVTNEFLDVYGEGIYHYASGQKAFEPACTLTEDEVEQAVWYDQNGNFINLRGEMIAAVPATGRAYDQVEYRGGSYLRLQAGGKVGIADMRGEVVLPPVYDAVAGESKNFFAAGYQAVMSGGKLCWLDMDGNVTASVPYTMNEGDFQGFWTNGLFMVTRALGETVVITATAGELPQRYEDAMAVASPLQRILCVKQNGLWGAIDLEGNAVIPFEHESQLQISWDGTVAIGQRGGQQTVYTVSFGDEPEAAVTAAPTAEPAADVEEPVEGWICPECGSVNTLNFCPQDGTARPEEPTECKSCHYPFEAGSDFKFCPNCGEPVS